MELLPSGVPLSFEVTFDSPSLHVGMSVYNDSGANPVLVSGPTAMALVYGNTYRGKFTGVENTNYIIVKAVYTTSGLSVLDDNYSMGSESCIAQVIGGGGDGGGSDLCNITGIVEASPIVVGIVESSEVVGFVQC